MTQAGPKWVCSYTTVPAILSTEMDQVTSIKASLSISLATLIAHVLHNFVVFSIR